VEIVNYLIVKATTDHLLCIVIRNCSSMTWRISGPICTLPARMTCYEQSPGSLSRQLKRARGEDHTVYVHRSGMPSLMGGREARLPERRR